MRHMISSVYSFICSLRRSRSMGGRVKAGPNLHRDLGELQAEHAPEDVLRPGDAHRHDGHARLERHQDRPQFAFLQPAINAARAFRRDPQRDTSS